MFNILVAEDDKNTRKLLSVVLKDNNFNPYLAHDGLMAIEVLENNHIDLMLVDIMMPKMNGLDFIKYTKEHDFDIPTIILSAKTEQMDKKEGFLAGTDDYMTKPVDPEELILRIKALLRRSNIANSHMIQIGNTTLNYDTFTISNNDKSIVLPKKEFLILFKLLSYPNKIFTKYDLMREFWGYDSDSDDHTINVHINRLRDKTKTYDDFEIITLRGLGYKAVKKDEKD